MYGGYTLEELLQLPGVVSVNAEAGTVRITEERYNELKRNYEVAERRRRNVRESVARKREKNKCEVCGGQKGPKHEKSKMHMNAVEALKAMNTNTSQSSASGQTNDVNVTNGHVG